MSETSSCLIVDDDPQVHDRATAVLAAFGYVVHSAPNAAEALRLSRQSMPDLLVTSVMLPDSNGLSLASQLRALSGKLAVVYMSANSDVVRVSGPLDAGSSSLRKPFEPEQLAGAVARLMPLQTALCPAGPVVDAS